MKVLVQMDSVALLKMISSHIEACGNVKHCSQQDSHPVDPDRDPLWHTWALIVSNLLWAVAVRLTATAHVSPLKFQFLGILKLLRVEAFHNL